MTKNDKHGVYFSVLNLYKERSTCDGGSCIKDVKTFMLMHFAESKEDADKKMKVQHAEQIFSDDYVEIFSCCSMKVDIDDVIAIDKHGKTIKN